jgi:hypothetical protein
MIVMLLAAGTVAGCQRQLPAPAPEPAATPATEKESVMNFESSADRLPPPDVPPVEQAGVRYSQAMDGRDVGANQVGGVLVATDAGSGKRLWTLTVYGNPVDPKLEADVQWVYFASMAFDPDGRLRIGNEAGKTFLVDVKARTVTPAN